MNKLLTIMLLTITFFITGCASSGNQTLKNETEESVKTKIIENKTTKSEVKSLFGSPDSTSFTDNGKEIWKYVLVDMKADTVNYIPIVNLFGSSASGTKKELVIMFNGDVVYRYSMSESDHAVKTGLFK